MERIASHQRVCHAVSFITFLRETVIAIARFSTMLTFILRLVHVNLLSI